MPAEAGTGLYLRFAPTKPLRVLAPDGVTIPSAGAGAGEALSPRPQDEWQEHRNAGFA